MPDFEKIKRASRKNYSRGNYGAIGSQLLVVAELLCETVDLRAGSRVLDVATGHGNAALAAARRNCRVTGLDAAPPLLELARERARVEGFDVEFLEGDCERLPFEDGSFDYVISTFGVQFTPDHEAAARELARVCRPGGRIGLANWTPGGFSAAYSEVIAKYVPPSGMPSPYRWGEEHELRALFGDTITSLELTERVFRYRFAEPEAWFACFCANFGSVMTLCESLGEGAGQLTEEMNAAVREYNEADDETLVLPFGYVDAVATCR